VIPTLDIFKLQPDGNLLWKGTAEDLGTAKLNVQVLAADSPGDYIIYSQQTGDKTIIKLDTAESSRG
jgi:hypothetical protein